jgi:hypothetical protein
VVFVTSLGRVGENATLTAYPNPNNGHFTLEWNNLEKPATIQIMNALGVVVYTTEAAVQGKADVDAGTFAPGVYYALVGEGTQALKIVISR